MRNSCVPDGITKPTTGKLQIFLFKNSILFSSFTFGSSSFFVCQQAQIGSKTRHKSEEMEKTGRIVKPITLTLNNLNNLVLVARQLWRVFIPNVVFFSRRCITLWKCLQNQHQNQEKIYISAQESRRTSALVTKA